MSDQGNQLVFSGESPLLILDPDRCTPHTKLTRPGCRVKTICVPPSIRVFGSCNNACSRRLHDSCYSSLEYLGSNSYAIHISGETKGWPIYLSFVAYAFQGMGPVRRRLSPPAALQTDPLQGGLRLPSEGLRPPALLRVSRPPPAGLVPHVPRAQGLTNDARAR